MTARNAATIASLVLLGAVGACTNYFEVPIETPISPKMDVSVFQRVLVAGFIAGGTEDVDANLETVRLLRSQLRSKSSLRVIEAEVLPLVEMAEAKEPGKTVNGEPAPIGVPTVAIVPPLEGPGVAASQPQQGQQGQQPPAAAPAQAPATPTAGGQAPAGLAPAGQAPDGKIRTVKDLERYQSLFADVAFWKKIGEEYQSPLIVTGTVLFTPHQVSGFVTKNQEVYDNLGRRVVVPIRTYMERKGFILSPTFIFIDGRTGVTLHRESMTQEVLYSSSQNTPALSSYFELMDQIVPSFLGSLSTQRIRGTRILLK